MKGGGWRRSFRGGKARAGRGAPRVEERRVKEGLRETESESWRKSEGG